MRVVVLLAILLLTVQPSAQEPSFEVASVKVTERAGGGFTQLPSASGRVRFDGADIQTLASIAFDVPLQLSEMRIAWTRATEGFRYRPGFQILATAPPGGGDQMAMLRTLLRERFGLQVHREMRQTPVFRLVVKEPGKLGPRLTPSVHNCREYRATGVMNAEMCGAPPQRNDGRLVRRAAGTIQDFIETVALSVTVFDRPVVDATGLTGNFLWDFAPPSARFIEGRMELDEVFDAFEDQLGLKLERAMAPWEVIVIDALHLPTPN